MYNCRTSNAWEMDLALTVTHYPSKRLTFAILLGCTLSIEEEIITRLSTIKSEAAHPLLMPGIFAELERTRHVKLVDQMVNEVEAKIFELDFQANDLDGPQGKAAEKRSREKRTAYLDLAYLRNALVSWNTQLGRMVQHCRYLNQEEYCASRSQARVSSKHVSSKNWRVSEVDWTEIEPCMGFEIASSDEKSYWPRGEMMDEVTRGKDELASSPTDPLWRVGEKIAGRLISLRDEYEDKIRDCTMRVDGMAMATQWVILNRHPYQR